MRLTRADVVTYRGRVVGARSAVERWSEREGLLLRLTTSDGRVGQGEASPLPRHSPDTIDAARVELGRVDWVRVPEPDVAEAAIEYLARARSAVGTLSASAAFAFETALLDLLGQERRAPIWALLAAEATPAPLSWLVGGADDGDAPEKAARARDRGAHTVKLKITGPRLGAQVETIARVRAAIGDLILRLDANQSFSADHASVDLAALCAYRPELVEEPVPPAELLGWSAPPLPVALDESLQDPQTFERVAPHVRRLGVVALVLKPMLLGGYTQCVRLAESAQAYGIDVTLSHLFDGPVALASTAHLALAVASRTRASGLARHGGLDAWPPAAVPFVGETTLVVGDAPGLGMARLSEPA